MRKPGIALLAMVVAAGVVCAVLLGTRPTPVSVRMLRVSRLEAFKVVRVEFELSNAADLSLTPKRLEHWTGTAWAECPRALGGFTGPGSSHMACTFGAIPAGRLRLVLNTSRQVKGLGSFWFRLQRRLSGRNARLSLRPFDKTIIFLHKPDVISDEFEAPP